MTYDIFISYRRDAFESANLFATRLKALGYRVFFDVESMDPGKFNEQLLYLIRECKDVITQTLSRIAKRSTTASWHLIPLSWSRN